MSELSDKVLERIYKEALADVDKKATYIKALEKELAEMKRENVHIWNESESASQKLQTLKGEKEILKRRNDKLSRLLKEKTGGVTYDEHNDDGDL